MTEDQAACLATLEAVVSLLQGLLDQAGELLVSATLILQLLECELTGDETRTS